MKKSSIYGWKEVFSFTLHQTFKSKAFRVTFVLFLLISIISMPLVNLLFNKDDSNKVIKNEITSVYVDNQTEFIDLDFSKMDLPDTYQGIRFQTLTESKDVVTNRIENDETDSVILSIADQQGMYNFEFTKPSTGSISKDNVTELSDFVQNYFHDYCISTLGVSQEQLTMLNATVETKLAVVDAQGVEIIDEDTTISFSEYWFIYGIFMVVLLVTTMVGSQIATSILSDKSSKVVEYLLTSIKPMAIIVGKILAQLVAVITQVISMIVVIFISNKVTAQVTNSGDSILAQVLPDNILGSLNIVNALVCLVLIALGFLFYATLAGLAGSTVSKMEEASEGLTLFTIVDIVGAYIGIAAANVMMNVGMNGFTTFACIFPLSSPFILPGAIIVGKVSLGIAAIAIVLESLFVFLLFKFVAKVYTTLILHNGNKISVKELFKISKIS